MRRGSRAVVLAAGLLAGLLGPSAATVRAAEPDGIDGARSERVLRVGVRDDARPFSYRGHTDASERVLEGYRGYMIEICRRVLREVVARGPFVGYAVEGVVVEARSRFDALDDGTVDLLCGPDSITAARLRTHSVSQPMFVSGMTYAYVDPKSPRFPRGPYCDNVVGVLRGTTAASVGLRRLADENVLLRFDEALEAYLAKSPTRRKELDDVIAEVAATYDGEKSVASFESEEAWRRDRQRAIDTGIGRSRGALARSIVTDECPNGFDGLPARSYRTHDRGIPALCRGEVLYYVGDYDIIARKVESIADCPVIVERFTRTKEVYAAFFRAGHLHASLDPSEVGCERCARDVLLYAAFNHTLLRLMQPHVDILAFEFEREFGSQAKSADLEAFFEGFRVVSDY